MGIVTVRIVECHTKTDSRGYREVSRTNRIGTVRLDLNLASAISVNALATPKSGHAQYNVRSNELRLIACLLIGMHQGGNPNGRDLHLDDPAFKASARHIKSFVTESGSLGLLTATASDFFRWRPHETLIENFDVLPASLQAVYSGKGVRPDLLFRLPSGVLAGEAKGRSIKKAPISVQSSQVKALNKLLVWSDAHGQHPVILTWTSFTPRSTVVDLFHIPGEDEFSPVSLWSSFFKRAQELGLDPENQVDDIVSHVSESPPEPETRAEDGQTQRAEDGQAQGSRPLQIARLEANLQDPTDLATFTELRMRTAETDLYDSAGQQDMPEGGLLGRTVRGRWMPLDLYRQTDLYLFFGILDAPPQSVGNQERVRLGDRFADIEIDHRLGPVSKSGVAGVS